MRKHILIVNLTAGKGAARKYIDSIKRFIGNKKEPYKVIYTEYPGHAEEIAREYSLDSENVIYSFGGDGTFNEVVNGVVNTDSVVVNIPTGSGNDFIKTVTDIGDPFEIFKRSFDSGSRSIDTMKINERYGINIASVGIDATVGYNAQKIKKIPFLSGSLVYLLSVFISLIKYKPYKLKMCFDDSQAYEKENLLVAIANGKYYGGGFKAVPHAQIDDGYLDICMADNMKRLRILSVLSKYKKGNHIGLKEIEFRKCKKINIESEEILRINIDGEIIEDHVLSIEIIPKSIKMAIINS